MKISRTLAHAAILALLLSACASTTTEPVEDGMVSSEAAMEEKDDAMMEGDKEGMMDEGDDDAMMEKDGEMMEVEDEPAAMAPRTIEVSMDNWKFTPATFKVKKGEKVTLALKGVAGNHGFAAPTLGINVKVGAGESVAVALNTDKEGSYEFFCSVPCGSGHKEMKGTIVIEA